MSMSMYKQIIRNIQIHILSDMPLDEPYDQIYNDIKDIFDNLNMYNSAFDNLIHFGYNKRNNLIDYNIYTEEFFINYYRLKMIDNISVRDFRPILEWYFRSYVKQFDFDNIVLDSLEKCFPKGYVSI